MPVFRLSNDSNKFPIPELARDDGLLAVGGDLNPERLLNAYSNGIFPWYNPDEMIKWWCPKDRFVIFPDKIHISNSMKKLLNKTALEVKINTDFDCIMRNCRMARENLTWITDEMERAYNKLFALGYALSVGIYENSDLVGGLYGVVIGKCFFGESMFSTIDNASKLALIKLSEKLAKDNFVFIDCQFHTDHLESMGGQYISWAEYKQLLNNCRD
ncbi:MAG: leucyl/phenylalanyl-tRNA--protein transferase [Defluviitaleaceae bacterium]|nr:leucyl/phenylalanyl-tRNA--protein transferase [Defluviitaleaceae bacterium]